MDFYTKISRKRFIVGLVFCFIAFAAFAVWGNQSSYFVGNIIPEALGVCVELLIVLWFFDSWQEKSKRKKLITIERRLREYLIFFLDHGFKDLPREYRIGRFFGEDHEQNIEQIKRIMVYIESEDLLEPLVGRIVKQCRIDVENLRSLLPAAAELTNDHFKAWNRIVYFVHCIAMSDEDTEIMTFVRDILQNIKRYDTASFDRKLYVGADD